MFAPLFKGLKAIVAFTKKKKDGIATEIKRNRVYISANMRACFTMAAGLACARVCSMDDEPICKHTESDV